MNRKELKQYLLKKDFLWKELFNTIYLARCRLSEVDLSGVFEISKVVDFCHNEDSFIELQETISWLDQNYEDFEEIIRIIRFDKNVPWQYEFVEIVSEISGIRIIQTLDIDTIIRSVAIAVITTEIDIDDLFETLDNKYIQIIESINNKHNLLRRNLLLSFESVYGDRFDGNIDFISFREMLDLYKNIADDNGIKRCLEYAQTKDIKLKAKEKEVMAFAYYCPYFCNEIDLLNNQLPQSSVFSCVSEALKEIRSNREKYEAENDSGELEKSFTFFIDDSDDCIAHVNFGKFIYTNVFIRRYPFKSLNNLLSNFIMCHNNEVFSVEFVNDFTENTITNSLQKRVKNLKQNIRYCEEMFNLHKDDDLKKANKYRHRYEENKNILRQFYYIM